jgi:hypothetical protein
VIAREKIVDRIACVCAVALLAVALASCGASAEGKDSPPAPSIAGPPCGRATGATLARSAGAVARRIYLRELSGTETQADRKQVEQYVPLAAALASGDRAAVRAAVTSLVFSHTHVVRLRVSRRGVVLADVGGPYILAPVSGELRFNGRVVGHYVLSVQDDVGYVKLETRFVGAPLVLHANSRPIPLEGTLAPGPARIPDLGPVHYRRASYEAFSFNASAFPTGLLRISLLVPVTPSLAATSCAEVKISELGHIAARTWRRFALASAPPSVFVHSVESLIGGLGYVRSGSHQLAGSTRPGPAQLPEQGAVRYRGVTYGVRSFQANSAGAAVRVYLLVAR